MLKLKLILYTCSFLLFIHRIVSYEKKSDHHKTLQLCKDSGEAYAASYLITKEHLINQYMEFDLSKTNTELASFMMVKGLG